MCITYCRLQVSWGVFHSTSENLSHWEDWKGDTGSIATLPAAVCTIFSCASILEPYGRWKNKKSGESLAVLHDIDNHCLNFNSYTVVENREQEAAVSSRAIIGVNGRKNSKSVSARDLLAGILNPRECLFDATSPSRELNAGSLICSLVHLSLFFLFPLPFPFPFPTLHFSVPPLKGLSLLVYLVFINSSCIAALSELISSWDFLRGKVPSPRLLPLRGFASLLDCDAPIALVE